VNGIALEVGDDRLHRAQLQEHIVAVLRGRHGWPRRTGPHTSLTAARSTTASALHRLAEVRFSYDEGIVTADERDAVLAEIAELARALGPDGAPLQEALGG
jgi:hypothetical protein